MNQQLSLFDFSFPQVTTPVQSPGISDDTGAVVVENTSPPTVAPQDEDIRNILLRYWSNSQDLAFCIANVLFDAKEQLLGFAEYIKACRLSDVSDDAPRPFPHKQFDILAECLKCLEFTRFDRGDNAEVIRTETTVLDFVVDVSFDEKELDDLRAFGVKGASAEQVNTLAEIISSHIEEADEDKAESQVHPYIAMLRRLGIPEESIPEPSDKDAVLKAMLDGIGESAEKFDSVLLDTDITKSDLLSAGSLAERKRFYRVLAKKLDHELACFSGTEQWYRHGGFWRHEILLTDGVMYLAENGGRNSSTAFWLIDAIASYQGEKVLARHPFQVWKLIVTPETEEHNGHTVKSRCARLVCTNGNNDKPIVEQEIEYTDFLLDEVRLYASVEPVDEMGKKKRVIILLPSEY